MQREADCRRSGRGRSVPQNVSVFSDVAAFLSRRKDGATSQGRMGTAASRPQSRSLASEESELPNQATERRVQTANVYSCPKRRRVFPECGLSLVNVATHTQKSVCVCVKCVSAHRMQVSQLGTRGKGPPGQSEVLAGEMWRPSRAVSDRRHWGAMESRQVLRGAAM